MFEKILSVIMAIVWTIGGLFYIGAGIVVAKTASTSCLFIIGGGFCILGGNTYLDYDSSNVNRKLFQQINFYFLHNC